MNSRSFKGALLRTSVLAGVALSAASGVAVAQEAQADADREVVVVTGTRIVAPGIESSSPVFTVSSDQIALAQEPEVERLIRDLPIALAADGSNVNNGTVGAATINLRGLGAQRNLIMLDGQRLTPFDEDGEVDTQVIPTAMLDRIDIITGGASTVYGSDAMSGAINFLLKRDFEGIEASYDYSITGENDGDIHNLSLTMGANTPDGAGNVMVGMNYTKREGVLLGDRPLGQLGIVTASGAGYDEFLAGDVPPQPPAGCQAPFAAAAGGSTTTIPTRVAIQGGPGIGQFRDDGTIGANCSVFNFNPFNYYQTPQERFGATAVGYYEINPHAEVYARASFSATNVIQQVGPSGIFGTGFWTPLSNPLIGDQARAAIIAAGNAGVANGTVSETLAVPNFRDNNNDGVVDAGDELLISYRRRTLELGPRSSDYGRNWFQFVTGVRGEINDSWNYDLMFSHGESDSSEVRAGYTNLENIEQQINSVAPGVCAGTSDPACVPIDFFGGFGSITPAMAAYAQALAIEQKKYVQTIVNANVAGVVDQVRTPWASNSLGLSFGAEYREENGESIPDECLKLAPVSCQGGAGGNRLPIEGGFSATEFYAEGIMPIVDGMTGVESLDLELGFRTANYDPTGVVESWKYGFSYEPIPGLRFRAMQQRAVRAPNVGELASPVVTGLDNANFDPCSVGNPNPIDATLTALCISTGMLAPQVGTVEDIVSGQINIFEGTNLAALPGPEVADTTTVGVVWTPDSLGIPAITRPTMTLDYYNIEINDYIEGPPAQAVLDGCYVLGDPVQCANVVRVGGNLTNDGSGVRTLTTNLDYLQAEGVEFGAFFGVDLETAGTLDVSLNVNKYITNEFQPDPLVGVTNCSGIYSVSCGGNFGTPLPEWRFTQRTMWNYGDFQFGYQWRYLGEVSTDDPANVFDAFETIDAYNYIDLMGNWQATDNLRVNAGVRNVFEEEPPVVGGEAGDTGSNNGNTFPSTYDVLGRVFTIGVDVAF